MDECSKKLKGVACMGSIDKLSSSGDTWVELLNCNDSVRNHQKGTYAILYLIIISAMKELTHIQTYRGYISSITTREYRKSAMYWNPSKNAYNCIFLTGTLKTPQKILITAYFHVILVIE